jgi:hypothetical protein
MLEGQQDHVGVPPVTIVAGRLHQAFDFALREIFAECDSWRSAASSNCFLWMIGVLAVRIGAVFEFREPKTHSEKRALTTIRGTKNRKKFVVTNEGAANKWRPLLADWWRSVRASMGPTIWPSNRRLSKWLMMWTFGFSKEAIPPHLVRPLRAITKIVICSQHQPPELPFKINQ